MINNFIKQALSGVTLGLILAVIVGVTSSVITTDRYIFTTVYPNIGREQIHLSLNHGRTAIQVHAYDTKEKLVISKQFFGLSLRFGSHYLLIATEQDTAEKQELLTVRSFFIKSHNENAYVIFDQRGVYITKDGRHLHLNSILTGKVIQQ